MKLNTILKGALLAMALIAIQETYAEISDIRQDLRNPLDIGGPIAQVNQVVAPFLQDLRSVNLQEVIGGLKRLQTDYQAGNLNEVTQNLVQRIAAAGYSVDTLRSLAESRLAQVKSRAAQVLNQLRTNAFLKLITTDVGTAANGLRVVITLPDIAGSLNPNLMGAIDTLFKYAGDNADQLQGLVNQAVPVIKDYLAQIQQATDSTDVQGIARSIAADQRINAIASKLQNLDRSELQAIFEQLKDVDFADVNVTAIKKAIQGEINSIGYLE